MKNVKYILSGIVFGLALTKGEAVSWYRIQEMFRFESFHMYGIFISAVLTGAIALAIIKRIRVKTLAGESIEIPKKPYHHGVFIGGIIFGFGWVLTGACPGPLYALIGAGYTVTLVTLASALLGVWVYALTVPYLPD